MAEPKFKVGDLVRVTGNNIHGITEGYVFTVARVGTHGTGLGFFYTEAGDWTPENAVSGVWEHYLTTADPKAAFHEANPAAMEQQLRRKVAKFQRKSKAANERIAELKKQLQTMAKGL